MSINRHNYDTYFLLYADGELSPAERQQVDFFVAQHPDRAHELALMRQAVLPAAPLPALPARENLYRPELWDAATLSPLQTQMILHLDGELSEELAQALELDLLTDPVAAANRKSLVDARLTAPLIEMPQKEKLYRKPPAAVRPLFWLQRFAAAAMLLGLGWLLIVRFSDETGQQKAGSVATVKKGMPLGSNPISERVARQQSGKAPLLLPSEKRPDLKLKAGNPTITPPQKVDFLATTAVERRASPEAPQQPEGPYLANVGAEAGAVLHPELGLPASENTAATVAGQAAFSENLALPAANAYATQAAYREIGEEEDDYIYVAGARIKKQRIRNVFRTVSRGVGRSLEKATIARVASETQSLRSP